MILYLGRRLLVTIPILIGVSIVVFLAIKIIPGDPVSLLAGPNATDATRAALRVQYGLDQPLIVQYFTWAWHAIQGNLGESISLQVPTLTAVTTSFSNTIVLAVYALVLVLVIGLGLGALAALDQRTPAGRIANMVASIAVSAPQYSIAFIFIIYIGLATGFFPVSGMNTVGSDGFGDLLWHGFLPALTAALVPAGIIARAFRASLLDTLSMDFVEALRARGLSRARVIGHAIHNTVPSILTMTGLQVGYLLGGVVFVETIFVWPGIGLQLFQAISSRDYPLIQAGVLVVALAFVLVNLVVDVAHSLIDPRVRAA